MPHRIPPGTASLATSSGESAHLYAPSAERNAGPIGDLLERLAPRSGRVLELASGTGQHAVAFAARLSRLTWQPSEVDPARMASINAHAADSGLPNIAPVIALDATAPGWSAQHSGYDLIVLVNLLHLISEGEARTLISEAAEALAPGGALVLYGPFRRDGRLTSEGDARFHASLVAGDPDIGYKNDADIAAQLAVAGLELQEVVEMPSNNLAFHATRGADQAK
jgi:SAM-dependent methyltransferase